MKECMRRYQRRNVPNNTSIYETIDEDGNVMKTLETTPDYDWCPPFDEEYVELLNSDYTIAPPQSHAI